MQKPEDAPDIIKQYEEILGTKKEGYHVDNILPRQVFQAFQREGKVYKNARKVKDSQKYFNF